MLDNQRMRQIVVGIAVLCCAATAQAVSKYGMYEAALTSLKTCNNPFMDPIVSVQFTSPSARVLNGYAFYDGDNTWRLRLAPDEVGTWSYSTTCSDTTNTGLHNKRGTFSCTASTHKGFLRPDPSYPYYFSFTEQSKPVFPTILMGWDTAIRGIRAQSRETCRNVLDRFKSYGFDAVWVRPFLEETELRHSEYLLSEVWPWGGTPSSPNFDYLNLTAFRLFEEYMDDVTARGLYAFVRVFNHYCFEKHPEWNQAWAGTRKAMWIRNFVPRFAGYTCCFGWMPEVEYEKVPDGKYKYEPSDDTWIRDAAAMIREADPHRRAVSFMQGGQSCPAPANFKGFMGTQFGADANVNPVGTQFRPDYKPATVVHTSAGMSGTAELMAQAMTNLRGWNKPVVDWECGFEWLNNSYVPSHMTNQCFSADTVRRVAWSLFVGGTGAYVSGFFTPPAPQSGGWITNIGYFKDFINNNTEFWRMAPDHGLVNEPNRCLRRTGVEYVVYARAGGTVSLNLSGVSGTFDVEWLNPRTGAYTKASVMTGGGTRTFANPAGDSNDWVLHLKANGTPTNQAPGVSAGSGRAVSLPSSASLDATVTDDGLPSVSSVTVMWSKSSEPGTLTSANSHAVDTTASNR